jgi:mercuric reductase
MDLPMCRPRSQDKYVHVAEQYQNLSILKGHTNLLAGRTVALNGTTYTPGKVLIATRSLPWTPPIPALREAGYIDSTEALSVSALPKSLIINGGGAIGLEFAQLFTRFGVRVIVLEAGPHLALGEEPEIGEALVKHLEAEKVTVCTTAFANKKEVHGDSSATIGHENCLHQV